MSQVLIKHNSGGLEQAPSLAQNRLPRQASAKPTRPRERRLYWQLLPWLLPIAVLLAWQTTTSLGWVAPQILPPPLHVCEYLRQLLLVGELWQDLAASLSRVVIGFALGASTGILLGAAMGMLPVLKDYLMPSFNAFIQIPIIGWLPLAMLLLGIGESLKYALVALAALIPVTYAMLQAFEQAPSSLLEVGRVFGFSRVQSITRIVLPAAVPTLFTGFRLGFTRAWLALVFVELIASSKGLGFLIIYGRQLFQMDLVMAAVVVLGIVGWVIDRLLDRVEHSINHRQGLVAKEGR